MFADTKKKKGYFSIFETKHDVILFTLILISTSSLFLIVFLKEGNILRYKSSPSPSEILSKLINVNAIACDARQASLTLLFFVKDFFNKPNTSSKRFSICENTW